ncbi:MAG: BTAD domain-containing putative transcriptional regulator [Thermoleophilaceae bacterium]
MSTPDRGRARTQDSLPDEVFRQLPYGIVVVDDAGAVVGWNDAAGRLLPGIEADEPMRCDDLLACSAPGGPCEAGCLAARAAGAGAPLPEIRIDAAGDGGATALWVTASPLDRESHAVLHLRPGDSRDRRRRSDPHWISGPELQVRAFGRMLLDSPESPLGGDWLGQRPGHVLKYLVCERNRVVHAEEMAEALWPGAGRQGLNNVRHFVHQLRERLEPGRARRAPSAFVVAVRGGYAVNRRHVRIDADDFERATQDGLVAIERGDNGAAREALERAVALYTGDFLADEPYAEWAYEERNRLRALAARGLRALARMTVIEGELPAAGAHLERLAALEPFDADVHRDLFAVWLTQGRRTEAARGFTAFRMRVLREFGEEPGFDLATLAPLVRRSV